MFKRTPNTRFLTLATALLSACGGAAHAAAAPSAREILETAGVKGGLVVHVGCGEGKLTAALHANDSYLVHGLDTDAANIQKAREHIRKLALYGKVSVDRLSGDRLPYVDNLVNLVVSEDLGKVSKDEVMRVLAPNGVAYIKSAGKWVKTIKPRPKEIDEWTHYMHDPSNNAVAHDSVVGPPRRLQWVGSPRWSRHHDHMSSVSAVVSSGGRVFYIFDEGSRASILLPPKWTVIARDAFNGTILWKRPIKKWYTHMMRLKSGPALLPRRLVAVGETVYVTLGIDAALTALDAATGETIRTYKGTEATQEVIASDGVLFLVADKVPARGAAKPAGRGRAQLWEVADRRLLAVRADTGEVLWRKEHKVLPLTLAADAKRVYFHDGQKALCLDRKKGDELWTSKPLPRWSKIPSYFAATLLVYQDIVLFAGGEKMIPHRGGKDTMTALDAATGKSLWTEEHPPSGYQSPEDLFVVGGLVWTAPTSSTSYSGVFTGRDVKTGKVKVQFPPDVKTYWFHHRCHRGKATEKYLLTSRTGIEFVDIQAKRWIINHWIRGACLYGVMPCNGLIYAPQHPCACYPEAKLNGFNAVAPASAKATAGKPAAARKAPKEDAPRLEKGPAYGKVDGGKAGGDDWPTYRHDPARSGFTKSAVPTDLKRTWQKDLGGPSTKLRPSKLSSVVVADGKLFVASVDTHTVHALDASSGKAVWSYTAGGRVDSPPTIYEGLALFGSADGWVYCLRAADGELAWRFRAAPAEKRLTSYEQVESVWPVHGSVLVQAPGAPGGDGVVYCVAGRSMFLDGGMRFLRLDPKTGKKLSETVLDDRDPQTGKDLQTHIKVLNMPVALPDILSSDGKSVYMRSQVFDLKGKRRGIPHRSATVQVGEGMHVFCPSGFLDDDYWHRSYWVYGRGFDGGHNGYHVAGRHAPAGRILAFDDTTVYGFGRKAKYYRWTTPLEHHLFADEKGKARSGRSAPAKAKPASAAGPWVSIANSASLSPIGKPLAVEAWVKADKPDGVVLARGGPAQGYALVLRDGQPRFAVRADNKVASVTAKGKVTGEWVHLAGVLTADKKLKIYVDGKLAGSATAPGLITAEPVQALEIGADDEGAVGEYKSPFVFTGLIDEVRVFYGTVTDAEIEKHSTTAGKAAAKDAKLVLCLSFDKGDAADASGNKNHGTFKSVKAGKGKFGGAMKFSGPAKSGAGRRKARPGRAQPALKHRWAQDIPFWVRAMVIAKETLFIAGPPDLVDEEEARRRLDDDQIKAKLAEHDASLEGKKGSLLWAVSTADGKKLAEYKLDSLPVFDGMAAANGRLYLVTKDGKVLCFTGR